MGRRARETEEGRIYIARVSSSADVKNLVPPRARGRGPKKNNYSGGTFLAWRVKKRSGVAARRPLPGALSYLMRRGITSLRTARSFLLFPILCLITLQWLLPLGSLVFLFVRFAVFFLVGS